MNSVKIMYYSFENTSDSVIKSLLSQNKNCKGFHMMKSGIMLVDFQGSAKELYDVFSQINDKQLMLIYDLDPAEDAFWGFMPITTWDWIKNCRKEITI